MVLELPGHGIWPMFDPSWQVLSARRAFRMPLKTNKDRRLPTTVSAVSKPTHNMSDTESSGAVTPAAETVNAPSAPPATNPDQPSSTFGNNRGSGLARGKRPVSPAPQAASAAPAADYKPTAVSIVTAPTEYKNPFAPPAPPAPVVEAAAPEVNPPAAITPVAPIAAPAPSIPAPAAEEVQPSAGETSPAPAAEDEPKAELKILPPETPKRVEHNWESQSFRSVAGQAREPQIREPQTREPQSRSPEAPGAEFRPRRDDRRDDRRGDRPVFRPERERRNDRPADFRAPGGDTARPAAGDFERRESAPPPRAESPKKSGGFFGWLKGLFSAPAPAAETTTPERRGEREFGRDGGYRRRRHRGGRGRRFHDDQRGPREGGPREGGPREGQSGGQPSGESRGQGGEGGEFRHRGGRHRRRRGGGGGGYRGEGGFRGDSGYRNDSRPDSGPPPAGS